MSRSKSTGRVPPTLSWRKLHCNLSCATVSVRNSLASEISSALPDSTCARLLGGVADGCSVMGASSAAAAGLEADGVEPSDRFFAIKPVGRASTFLVLSIGRDAPAAGRTAGARARKFVLEALFDAVLVAFEQPRDCSRALLGAPIAAAL